ncbi:apolipoprotein C-I-like [Pagrus major]|uniref:apolipoprotein C-I-like n=1 Tax=Pagrus major TaxID=143350 RepID=UPI003CC840B5
MLTQSLLVFIKRNTHRSSITLNLFFSCQTENRVKAKMRLFLAVAVLMLAFVAYTEAQEESIEQKFTQFGERVSQVGQDLAEKARTAFDSISNSEAVTNTKNWFSEHIEKLKSQFSSK